MLQNDFSALIVGAGSAGHACAAELRRLAPNARVTVIDDEPGGPINRMLVTKGVLPGLLGPELIAQPPLPGVERVNGRAVTLLRPEGELGKQRGVRLADGTELFADAVVVATGSNARPLGADIEVDPAVPLYSVQTAADAVALREVMAAASARADATAVADVPAASEAPGTLVGTAGAAGTAPADKARNATAADEAARDERASDEREAPRLIVIGAGFIGTEVASHFAGTEVDVIVIGRSGLPLAGAFGERIAAGLGELHKARGAILDKSVRAIRAQSGGVSVTLDDGSTVTGNAVAAAVGVVPESGWAGRDGGLQVDGHLRVLGAGPGVGSEAAAASAGAGAELGGPGAESGASGTEPGGSGAGSGAPGAEPAAGIGAAQGFGLYAAGGVAAHTLSGELVAIDHWDAAAEQGKHAARAILFDLEIGEDPGAYVPKSGFTLQAYGKNFAGYGYQVAQGAERDASPCGGVELTKFVDEAGVFTGAAGLNAASALRELLDEIGTRA